MNYKVHNQEQLAVARQYCWLSKAGKMPDMRQTMDKLMQAVCADGEYREYNTALSGEKGGGK